MPKVTLPDKSVQSFDKTVSVEQIAYKIGPALGKSAVAAKVDDILVDASFKILKDCKLQILTNKDLEGLEIIRHSCAHLLAHALKQIFPDVKLAIGPVIEDGFYYDIFLEDSLNEDDLVRIEERMLELAKSNYDVIREVVDKEKAKKVFKSRNEPYKLEIIEEIPKGETIALYHHQEYIDMCRGPHIVNTRHLKVFKLTKLSGIYRHV